MNGFYLAAHWRGEHSLARSYWVNGVLLTIAIRLAFLAMEPLQQDVRLEAQLVTGLVLLAVVAIVVVWQLVGIWRSAANSTVRNGRAFWPIVAKIMVVIGAISAAGQIWTGGKDSINVIAALRDPVLTEFTLEQRGTTDLIFTGAINDRSVAEGRLGDDRAQGSGQGPGPAIQDGCRSG